MDLEAEDIGWAENSFFSENVASVKKCLQKRLSVHSEGCPKLCKVSTTFESESLKKQLSKCQSILNGKFHFGRISGLEWQSRGQEALTFIYLYFEIPFGF